MVIKMRDRDADNIRDDHNAGDGGEVPDPVGGEEGITEYDRQGTLPDADES